MKIQIINGPNLNLLGKREPDIYGNSSFDTYLKQLNEAFSGSCEISSFQSNHEGEILDKLHEVGFSYSAIVLNAGAFTHSSIALLDAIKAIETPVIEVHISNIYAREDFRHKSIIAPACVGSINGLGLMSYELAIRYILSHQNTDI